MAANSSDQPLFISTVSGGRDINVVQMLNKLFLDAANESISDIHFDEREGDAVIKYRRGNDMEAVMEVSTEVFTDIGLKIRSKSKMELVDRRRAMDGRFKLFFEEPGFGVDVRVSIVPNVSGTSIVCRVLDQRNATRELDRIYMPEIVRSTIRRLISKPDGLFLMTGPTGSGKTSTLYSIINELNVPYRQILTIEDPVEYRVEGLRQINVEQNINFPQAMRAALRQDPDIILVGEIRDAETAKIAVEAANTGHLVLSTLHTNDAASTITRMIDLGVDPYTLGSALIGVVAQRLVKALDECPETRMPTEEERLWMRSQGVANVDDPICVASDVLGGSGYSGKVPVIELIEVDKKIQQAMIRNDTKLIASLARRQPQFKTLAQAGMELCREGRTSIAQVRMIASGGDGYALEKTLGEVLVEWGELSFFQLSRATKILDGRMSSGEAVSMQDLLVELGYCEEETVKNALTLL